MKNVIVDNYSTSEEVIEDEDDECEGMAVDLPAPLNKDTSQAFMRQLTLVCEEKLENEVIELNDDSDTPPTQPWVDFTEVASIKLDRKDDKELKGMLNEIDCEMDKKEIEELFDIKIETPVEEEKRYIRERNAHYSMKFREQKSLPEDEQETNRLLPPCVQSMFDYKQEKSQNKITYHGMMVIKMKNLYWFNSECRNCFHRGFMSCVVCEGCKSVLDVWPSRFKKIYTMPSKACRMCRGLLRRISNKEVSTISNEKRTGESLWEFFRVTLPRDEDQI